MNIAVINGSPKGKYSITLQTVLYLQRKFPEHTFDVLHAGQKIKALEKDFSTAKQLMESADAVLFSYPVYTFLAPSQLHRFIELTKETGVCLKGKYATQISTSKHFYDVTAHKYIEENALDLGMGYIRGLSADMEDLLSEKGRKEAEQFFQRFLWAVKENICVRKAEQAEMYQPVEATVPQAVKEQPLAGKDIVILTDTTDPASNLSKMIARFRMQLPFESWIVNIAEYPLAGGCLGCFRCAVSEKCVYKDGFDSFLRDNIQKADAIVYAFSISDHSMGARFKMYDDRNFCNGHRTVTVGMPIGYLVSGPYSAEHNLATVIEARSETGGNFLAGVATDETEPDLQVDQLAKSLTFALETGHTAPPRNFWGVGGMKIFRDLIYQMRGMMRADHKFYKKQGIYDFPQKKKLTSLKMYMVGMLLANEKILQKMGNKMNEGMLAPYAKLFAQMDKETSAQ